MQIPFVGQYLASHGASNGDLGYLILNVDSDKGGKGIVYQSSVIPGNSAIYECQVFVDQNGVISGHAVRSKRLETFHRMQTPDEVHELTFKLEPRDGLHHRQRH